MTKWDDVHWAYHLACGEKPTPMLLKAFLAVHPEFALDLIEVTFIALEMAWNAEHSPEDEPLSPELLAAVSERVRVALDRADRQGG